MLSPVEIETDPLLTPEPPFIVTDPAGEVFEDVEPEITLTVPVLLSLEDPEIIDKPPVRPDTVEPVKTKTSPESAGAASTSEVLLSDD